MSIVTEEMLFRSASADLKGNRTDVIYVRRDMTNYRMKLMTCRMSWMKLMT